MVAVVGDNSTDTEEDARWTLGLRAPMGTDGWVGGAHTGRTCDSARTRKKKREREITPESVILHFTLFLSVHPSPCI